MKEWKPAECCEAMKDAQADGVVDRELLNGEFVVPGCCGGGCLRLYDIGFCPWCGAKLLKEEVPR